MIFEKFLIMRDKICYKLQRLQSFKNYYILLFFFVPFFFVPSKKASIQKSHQKPKCVVVI